MTPERHTLARRLKAARTLAGYDSADALAAEIHRQGGQRGYGATTIRRWEVGRDAPPGPDQLAYIANVCGVSPAFFSVDLSRLGEPQEPADAAGAAHRDRLDLMEQAIVALQTDLETLAGLVQVLSDAAARTTRGQGRREPPPSAP
jgi:transcriptional regulator with XRE-family HTH domain